ncbi:hypothetical protein D3C84_1136320 [compost metagenome]
MLELTIEPDDRDQRTAIILQQRWIDLRPAPTGLRVCLQSQHPQGGKVRARLSQGIFMGRRPLTLPDVELLIEGRCVLLLATAEQRGAEH